MPCQQDIKILKTGGHLTGDLMWLNVGAINPEAATLLRKEPRYDSEMSRLGEDNLIW